MRKAIKTAKLKLGNFEVEVAVLDDGTRVVTEEGLVNFMKFLESDPDDVDMESVQNFCAGLHTL